MENIEKREKLCKNMEEQGKTSGKHFKKPWDVWENVGKAGRKTVIRFGKVLINFEKPLVNNYSITIENNVKCRGKNLLEN